MQVGASVSIKKDKAVKDGSTEAELIEKDFCVYTIDKKEYVALDSDLEVGPTFRKCVLVRWLDFIHYPLHLMRKKHDQDVTVRSWLCCPRTGRSSFCLSSRWWLFNMIEMEIEKTDGTGPGPDMSYLLTGLRLGSTICDWSCVRR